jgi:hypothetical protein
MKEVLLLRTEAVIIAEPEMVLGFKLVMFKFIL